MAISAQLAGQSLFVPGSYSDTKVALVGSRAFLARGRVAIFGEADGGEPGATAGVVRFTSADLAALIQTYGSGRLVEAARLLINPSNDGRIINGASEVLVFKTNASTQAELALDTGWGTLKSVGYGVQENLIAVELLKTDAVLGTGSSSAPFDIASLSSGNTFILRENGGAANTYTHPAGVTTVANLQTELDNVANWSGGLPAEISFTVGGTDPAATITISLDASATDHQLGYGRTFELDDGAGTPLATMNLSEGLVANTSDPSLQIITSRSSDDVSEDSDDINGDIGGQTFLEIGYEGTTATITVGANTLTTSVTGGAGAALNINFSEIQTLSDLADFINAQAGYTCSLPTAVNPALSPSALDRVTGIGICSSGAGLTPGKLKADAYSVFDHFDRFSGLVDAERTSYLGLPDELTPKQFLTGAVRGASANSDFTAALTAFEAEEVDVVVPLVSQDASDDLSEDQSSTDAGSSYTADSIITAVKNHCKKMGSTKNRKERQSYAGARGTFQEMQDFAKTLQSELMSLAIQDILAVDASGNLVWHQPWGAACLAAGMQAGGEVGQPTTKKFISANGIRHLKKQGTSPSTLEGFKPLSQSEIAIQAGIMPLDTPPEGGVQLVVQNSTYSKDGNFVFNRPSVVEASFFVAKNLRKQLDNTFVGTKNKGIVTKETVRVFVTALMADFLKLDIIVGDDSNDGLGYKDLNVSISGSTIEVDITITPVQGVDFILNRITLDTIRVAA